MMGSGGVKCGIGEIHRVSKGATSMSFVQILVILILWFAAAIAIEKILPLIMEDFKKSKSPISFSSALIAIFVVAIIVAVFSVV